MNPLVESENLRRQFSTPEVSLMGGEVLETSSYVSSEFIMFIRVFDLGRELCLQGFLSSKYSLVTGQPTSYESRNDLLPPSLCFQACFRNSIFLLRVAR